VQSLTDEYHRGHLEEVPRIVKFREEVERTEGLDRGCGRYSFLDNASGLKKGEECR
jgi:hypothetical protein